MPAARAHGRTCPVFHSMRYDAVAGRVVRGRAEDAVTGQPSDGV